MLNKLFALAVRGGITFGIGFTIAFTLNVSFNSGEAIAWLVAGSIWLTGGIYSFSKFNTPFNVNSLKEVDDKIHSIIDDKNMKKTEDVMLRVKKLLDSGILTQEEYEQKMKVLKNKYL